MRDKEEGVKRETEEEGIERGGGRGEGEGG